MNSRPKSSLLLLAVLILIVNHALFYRCANRMAPTGGPKDSIPPLVIKAIPPHQSLNYKGNIIVLEFNEWIKEKDFNEELLITPPNKDFTHKVSKTRIEINFLKPLLENTTYSLNFRAAIVDITEGNVARWDTIQQEGLKLAFSTGNHIDSMRVSGKVVSALTNQPLKEILVSLYKTDDTLRIDKHTPYYFTRTDEAGYFQIDNIKDGSYEIFAIKDYTENLIYEETENESIGFIADTLTFGDTLSHIHDLVIKLNKEDFTPPSEVRSGSLGEVYEIDLSKGLIDFELTTLDSTQNNLIAANLVGKGQQIRVYNLQNVFDTIPALLYMLDSLGNSAEQDIKILFKEAGKKQKITRLPFNFEVNPSTGKELEEDLKITIRFSKPVSSYDFDKIKYILDEDSTTLAPLLRIDSTQEYQWDTKFTQLSIDKKLPFKNNIQLLFDSTAFMSIQQDSSGFLNKKLTKKDPSNFGTISGEVKTEIPHFVLQLIDDKNNLIAEKLNVKKFEFAYLPAGTYSIRVIIDSNQNGRWDSSNYAQRTPPEEILFFSLPNEGKLRERWDIQNAVIEF
ncbi:MAG: Ig-like domain-containing domain [Microscillaceae bacterium]|nr:Ig-like domain-containing domain [Microscillaceae bacterium]